METGALQASGAAVGPPGDGSKPSDEVTGECVDGPARAEGVLRSAVHQTVPCRSRLTSSGRIIILVAGGLRTSRPILPLAPHCDRLLWRAAVERDVHIPEGVLQSVGFMLFLRSLGYTNGNGLDDLAMIIMIIIMEG